MKKVLFAILAVLLLAGSIFLTTGCARAAQRATSRAIESVIEKELAKEGITVEGDGEEYTIKAESDDGTSEMTWGSTELPEGIPSAVNIYPNMNINFSAKESKTSSDDEKDMFQIVAESNDSLDKIVEWHKSQYGNWDEFSTMSWSSDDGEAHMFSAQNGSWSEDYMIKVDIIIGEDDGLVMVSYSIEERRVK